LHFFVLVFLRSPGTKRVSRVEENTAADAVELSAAQLDTLNNLTPAAGEHHNEEQMAMYERRAGLLLQP
jgi:hypothetical protein